MVSKADQYQNPISVNIDIDCDVVTFDTEKLKSTLAGTCPDFGVSSVEINLAIVDSGAIAGIHLKFLGSDKNTDVISFDTSEQDSEKKVFDIVVNAEMAQLQAKNRNITAESELALYCLHGLLHNLGFDDIAQDDAKKMHSTEDEILHRCGYGIVYKAD